MAKRLLVLSCIFALFFSATSWANEGLISFKVVESPLEVQVSVKKVSSYLYKIEGTVLNKGAENIYSSQAKVFISPEEGVKLKPYYKKLGTLRASQTKKFSFNASVEHVGTYSVKVIVSGFNKSGNTEHVMGAETNFTVQASSSFLSQIFRRLASFL